MQSKLIGVKRQRLASGQGDPGFSASVPSGACLADIRQAPLGKQDGLPARAGPTSGLVDDCLRLRVEANPSEPKTTLCRAAGQLMVDRSYPARIL